MAMLVLIQIALVSLVMAQESFPGNNYLDSWWFQLKAARNPSPPLSTTCLLSSQLVVRRDDYTYTPGIGGHKVHTNALLWNDARRICQEEGGHLAIINSIAEATVIVELFGKAGPIVGGTGSTDYISVGFHDSFKEGDFVTIHDQSISRAGYNQWQSGQPDNSGVGEDCGSIHRSGGLNDIGCAKTYGYVCEVPFY